MNITFRIYYEDTDAGGVVYHARYLHFFERARTEFLRQLGFSQQALLQESIAFVVKKITIDYRIAARLDDLIQIETTINELKKASLVFQQRLLRDGNCLAEASVFVASIDLEKMKPIAIPEAVVHALTSYK